MANSILFTDVVAFGRKLVEELNLEPGVDTTSRWLAHYIAERIFLAESAEGSEKIAAEHECFEAILQLWKHRASLPGTRRPMESFEPIFNVLEQLLDHKHLVYFRRSDHKLDPENKQWLDLATSIDHAARELIRWCIAMASLDAIDKEGPWLESETAQGLDDGPDLKAARLLVENINVFIGTKEQVSESRAKELTEIRNRLNGLVTISKSMCDQIDAALSDTSSKD